jgi:hypothetical protein
MERAPPTHRNAACNLYSCVDQVVRLLCVPVADDRILGVVPLPVPRAPLGALGTEVVALHPGVEQLDNRAGVHAPRCLVLVDGRAAADGVVHELVESALGDDAYLERADGSIAGAALPVHAVQGLFHR